MGVNIVVLPADNALSARLRAKIDAKRKADAELAAEIDLIESEYSGVSAVANVEATYGVTNQGSLLADTLLRWRKGWDGSDFGDTNGYLDTLSDNLLSKIV